MRTPLDKILRSKLEKAVEKARDTVEIAVTEALTRLGVNDGSAPSYLSEAERKLRNRLRAHGRQLGDVLSKESGKQETELLVNEMAYEHWHRMLFARFLEQSDLLMYDENTPITLDDCAELVEEGDPLGDGSEVKDGWDLAGRLAQKMLPQIFRADSPVFDVKLSINHVHALEELIAELHPDTFQASDALGWCYQFWQNKKKKQVNESGVKIGAKELSPVTQLFTEPYMVSFLLDNALGAWWAKRRLTQDDLATATSEQELRERASIPGVPLEYLRFIKDEESGIWKSAAGDFDKWPEDLSEFKTLDPCCGSGHFLVAKFLMLVPIRMELEGLAAKEAIDKVLAQNIHGLELDQRCVELAAFALALEAWRYPCAGGYRVLPELQLACSGISITEAQKEWKDLAKGDEELESAIKWMQETFKDAPTLGSLIEPNKRLSDVNAKPWKILEKHFSFESDVSVDTKTMAQGLAKAAEILTSNYEWIVTNVPYLISRKQVDFLNKFCHENYRTSKYDLGAVFMMRAIKLSSVGGLTSLVMPQNWLFLSSYTKMRLEVLNLLSLKTLVKLGYDAFRTPLNASPILLAIENTAADELHSLFSLDLSNESSYESKVKYVTDFNLSFIKQKLQIKNPDHRISIAELEQSELLSETAISTKGITTNDDPLFVRCFYENSKFSLGWEFFQGTSDKTCFYGGADKVVFYENGTGLMRKHAASQSRDRRRDKQGIKVWGKKGVAVSCMGDLPVTLYMGNKYNTNVATVVPKNVDDLASIWSYCESSQYSQDVRSIDQALKVTNATLVKVPFDNSHWRKLTKIKFPNGLPQPFTNDSTQWIFHGHPCASVIWDEETKTTVISELREDDTVLQVAVARLLGYRWPAELDSEMELAPEMREIIVQNKVFDGLVDDDGIVCLSSYVGDRRLPTVRGEHPVEDRLEAILHAAYGDKWSATVLNNLLKSVKSRDLNIWLRDKFFEQHCKLFQHRPFIWHIWDGLPDGFSALVNYHQLDYKGLERLIYTYLDDWISTQIQLEKDGDEGAEIRSAAARNLRKQLEDILIGEEGLDIFVRWKSLAEQPIGWNPDLNDGVRLNIRPFMKAKDVGKKGAGILRSKPNVHWKKDRGTDVESAPWYDLGLEYGGKQGDRINDHHLTLAEKTAARDKV